MREFASLHEVRPLSLPLAVRGASSESPAWMLLAGTITATTVLIGARGLSFDWGSVGRPFIACVGLSVATLIYRTWRPDERIAATLVAVAQIIAFSAAGEALSYAVASLNRSLWDTTLLTWDRALGLDWGAYLAFVNAHPILARVLNLAYNSFTIQMIAAAGVLGLTGRFAARRQFVLATMLAAIVTILVSGVMPALSMVTRLGLRAGDYPNFDFSVGAVPFLGLRDGTMRIISLANAEGIISFPSFHAALGVIFAKAFWSVKWARWPALACNALMIAATPLDGGHFFVDVIAGIAIALGAIAAANALERPLLPQPLIADRLS